MEIEKRYERLVKDLTIACKSLGWSFETEQDTDGLLFLIIDQCRYFVSPTTESDNLYYLGVMVQHHGNRDEPPSEDEAVLSKKEVMAPHYHIGDLLDVHWAQRKGWAMEATLTPEEGLTCVHGHVLGSACDKCRGGIAREYGGIPQT